MRIVRLLFPPFVQDVAQLEARLREVTDMLYLKQNQLERLSADKAAQQILIERDLQQARDEVTKLRHQVGQQRDDAHGTIHSLSVASGPLFRLDPQIDLVALLVGWLVGQLI